MKILVPCKRVIDPYVKIRVKSDGSGVELANVKMALNPFDEIAVEEAVRLREKNLATEVIVVTIGTAQAGEMLRTAMALGADRGILVPYEEETQPLGVAKALAALTKREETISTQLSTLARLKLEGVQVALVPEAKVTATSAISEILGRMQDGWVYVKV